MGQRMKNAPVYYALGQVVFNPIAKMGDYIPAVQDILRRQGYTVFHEIKTQTAALKPGEQELILDVKESTAWLIDKDDKASGFIIDGTSLIYQTANYDTFETFLPELIKGIETLHNAAGIQHISRMGLRYLDAVIPQEGEAVTEYLQPELRGLQSCNQNIPMRHIQSFSETIFTRHLSSVDREGIMAVRVYQAYGKPDFPGDVKIRNLHLQTSYPIGLHAVIDTDHYFTTGPNTPLLPFSIDVIQRCMDNLHHGIGESFQCAVTDHAMAIWKGEA